MSYLDSWLRAESLPKILERCEDFCSKVTEDSRCPQTLTVNAILENGQECEVRFRSDLASDMKELRAYSSIVRKLIARENREMVFFLDDTRTLRTLTRADFCRKFGIEISSYGFFSLKYAPQHNEPNGVLASYENAPSACNAYIAASIAGEDPWEFDEETQWIRLWALDDEQETEFLDCWSFTTPLADIIEKCEDFLDDAKNVDEYDEIPCLDLYIERLGSYSFAANDGEAVNFIEAVLAKAKQKALTESSSRFPVFWLDEALVMHKCARRTDFCKKFGIDICFSSFHFLKKPQPKGVRASFISESEMREAQAKARQNGEIWTFDEKTRWKYSCNHGICHIQEIDGIGYNLYGGAAFNPDLDMWELHIDLHSFDLETRRDIAFLVPLGTRLLVAKNDVSQPNSDVFTKIASQYVAKTYPDYARFVMEK